MKHKNEQGFILPVVIAILTIVTFVVYLLLSHSVRNRQSSLLYQEMINVTYLAESGLAMMQHQLWKQKQADEITTSIDGVQLQVHAQKQATSWLITITAYGKWRVKRTLKGEIDVETLAFRRWIE